MIEYLLGFLCLNLGLFCGEQTDFVTVQQGRNMQCGADCWGGRLEDPFVEYSIEKKYNGTWSGIIDIERTFNMSNTSTWSNNSKCFSMNMTSHKVTEFPCDQWEYYAK